MVIEMSGSVERDQRTAQWFRGGGRGKVGESDEAERRGRERAWAWAWQGSARRTGFCPHEMTSPWREGRGNAQRLFNLLKGGVCLGDVVKGERLAELVFLVVVLLREIPGG